MRCLQRDVVSKKGLDSQGVTATSGKVPGSLTNGGRSEGTVAADKKGKSTAVMQSGSSDHGSHSTWRRNYMPLKSPHLTRITSANQAATAPMWCWWGVVGQQCTVGAVCRPGASLAQLTRRRSQAQCVKSRPSPATAGTISVRRKLPPLLTIPAKASSRLRCKHPFPETRSTRQTRLIWRNNLTTWPNNQHGENPYYCFIIERPGHEKHAPNL